jgi:hypothetical protein
MDRDQGRRRFDVFRQVEIALQLDAVVIGVGDAVMDRNAVRHFLVSWLEPRAMVKRFWRGRTRLKNAGEEMLQKTEIAADSLVVEGTPAAAPRGRWIKFAVYGMWCSDNSNRQNRTSLSSPTSSLI